jgi:hypothetical protein
MSPNGSVSLSGPLLLNGTDLRVAFLTLQAQYNALQDQLNALKAELDSQKLVEKECYNLADPSCGWKKAWEAPTDSAQYSGFTWLDSQAMFEAAEMIVGYNNTGQGIFSQLWRFKLPNAWRTYHPFNDACGLYPITAVRVSDGLIVRDSIMASYANFGTYCDEPCSGPATQYGRFCLRNGAAHGALDFPYFNAWSTPGGDNCCSSMNGHSCAYTYLRTTGCSADIEYLAQIQSHLHR